MFSITKRLFEPVERIEFGFVLLPDDNVLQEIKQISETITSLLHPLAWQSNLPNQRIYDFLKWKVCFSLIPESGKSVHKLLEQLI